MQVGESYPSQKLADALFAKFPETTYEGTIKVTSGADGSVPRTFDYKVTISRDQYGGLELKEQEVRETTERPITQRSSGSPGL